MIRTQLAERTDEDTLGIEQAARLMRLGVEAMRELVITGEVPALICNQKHAVLLRTDVLDYIRDQGRKQAEERRRKTTGKPTPERGAPAATKPRARARQQGLPDLARYELTTDAPPGSTPSGSRSA